MAYRVQRPSKRAVRNHLEFLAGGTAMEQAPVRKRGPQPEGAINKAIIQAARLRGATLYRNRRGMLPLPNGGMLPFGLGPAGYPDNVGYLPITITPGMVGRKVAIFCAIEAKTDTGVLAEHQARVIEELRDAGAIAGVATSATDTDELIRRWERV